MLLLAYLLSQSREWKGYEIVLKTIVNQESESRNRQATLLQICQNTRISAKPEVFVLGENEQIRDVIQRESKDCALIFMGLSSPETGKEKEFGENLRNLVEGMPSVVLVRNSGRFRGGLLGSSN